MLNYKKPAVTDVKSRLQASASSELCCWRRVQAQEVGVHLPPQQRKQLLGRLPAPLQPRQEARILPRRLARRSSRRPAWRQIGVPGQPGPLPGLSGPLWRQPLQQVWRPPLWRLLRQPLRRRRRLQQPLLMCRMHQWNCLQAINCIVFVVIKIIKMFFSPCIASDVWQHAV